MRAWQYPIRKSMIPKLIDNKEIAQINTGYSTMNYRLKTWDVGIIGEVIHGDSYGIKPIFLPKDRVPRIIDLGAHIGAFSTLAKALWPNSKIVAVEPDIHNFKLLESNVPKDVRVVWGAAGNRNRRSFGVLRYKSTDNTAPQEGQNPLDWGPNTGGSCMISDPAQLSKIPPNMEVISQDVKFFSLNEIYQNIIDTLHPELKGQSEPYVDILKVDCEGFEVEILRDGEFDLSKIDMIVGECHSDSQRMGLLEVLTPTHSLSFSSNNQLCNFVARSRKK